MRIDINYEKEGFYQVFPLLYINNDNESAIVIGFGKKNLAFVFGENQKKLLVVDYTFDSSYKGDGINQQNKSSILGLFGKDGKLTDTQKLIIVSVVGLACVSVLYYAFRKRK